MKLTQEYINNIIKKNGYIPMDTHLTNYLDKVYFKDIQGYKYASDWEVFKRGRNKFKPIIYSNPFSAENAKLYLILNNISMELLSTEIKSVTQKLRFKAECGHETFISWSKLQKRKYYLCEKCYQKQKGIDSRLSEKKVEKLFNDNGYILLEDYKTTSYPLLCEDKDGYIGKLSYNNLKLGKTFDIFSSKNLFVIANIKHYLNINNIDLTLLSNYYINCDTDMLWECSCGNQFYKKWDYIRSNKGCHCKECNHKSNIEITVENFLNDNKIEYIKEYKYQDCGNIKPYPFDFYLLQYNICIEVDGEQHFKPVRFGGISQIQATENFKSQQERDSIKTEYCKNNNINLIRISYKEIKDNTYKRKINQWLK